MTYNNDLNTLQYRLSVNLGNKINVQFNPYSPDILNIQYKKQTIIIHYQENNHLIILIPPKCNPIANKLINAIKLFLNNEDYICTYNLEKKQLKYQVWEWNLYDKEKRMKSINTNQAFPHTDYVITNIKENKQESRFTAIKCGIPFELKEYTEECLFYHIKSIYELLNDRELKITKYIYNYYYSQLEYYIYQTKRYGVELNEPNENEPLIITESYNQWYLKWLTIYNNLSSIEKIKFTHLASTNKNYKQSKKLQLKKK